MAVVKYRAGDSDQEFNVPHLCSPDHDFSTASDVAEDYHDNHDGREDSWPLVITLISDDGLTSRWDIEREFCPFFWATEIKEPKA